MSEMLPAVEERQIKGGKVQAPEIMAIENLINNSFKKLGELNLELRSTRQMYVDSFINDAVYHAKSEKVLKASRELKGLKAGIAKQEGVAQLEQKIKDLSADKREIKKSISDLALRYREQSGIMQLTLFNDEVVDITLSAKLTRHPKGVSKRGKKRK